MSTSITSEAPTAAPPQLNFIDVLRRMLKTSDKVSDLIFSPGRPPQVEKHGDLTPVADLPALLAAWTAAPPGACLRPDGERSE